MFASTSMTAREPFSVGAGPSTSITLGGELAPIAPEGQAFSVAAGASTSITSGQASPFVAPSGESITIT